MSPFPDPVGRKKAAELWSRLLDTSQSEPPTLPTRKACQVTGLIPDHLHYTRRISSSGGIMASWTSCLFANTIALYRQGQLNLASSPKVFDVSEVRDAFRALAAKGHSGYLFDFW
ncbi:hypothetical protein KEM56_006317, partial [Ascosphaera pollenicola]